jgi:hypothetical protein
MNLRAFKMLDIKEQFDIVYEQGVMLLDRNDQSCSYLLYQVDGFYVEVKHELSVNEISAINSFSSVDLLEPYLETIEIDF